MCKTNKSWVCRTFLLWVICTVGVRLLRVTWDPMSLPSLPHESSHASGANLWIGEEMGGRYLDPSDTYLACCSWRWSHVSRWARRQPVRETWRGHCHVVMVHGDKYYNTPAVLTLGLPVYHRLTSSMVILLSPLPEWWNYMHRHVWLYDIYLQKWCGDGDRRIVRVESYSQ